MKTLERLDRDGNVIFAKEYPAKMAAHMLTNYKYYPQTQLVMWREKVEEPKRTRKYKEDETN